MDRDRSAQSAFGSNTTGHEPPRRSIVSRERDLNIQGNPPAHIRGESSFVSFRQLRLRADELDRAETVDDADRESLAVLTGGRGEKWFEEVTDAADTLASDQLRTGRFMT
jgi:hypothetical protein